MMTTNRTLPSIDLDALLETVIDGRTEEEEEEEEEYSYRLWSSDSEGLVDDPQEVASYEVTGLSREELIHRSPHIEYWAPSVGRHHTLSPIYESRDVSSRYGRSVCIIAQPRETLDDEEGGRREPLIKDGVGGGRGEALSAEGRGGGKSESLIKEGGGGGGGTRGHLPPSYTETQRNILTGRTKRCCGVNCGACEHRAETDNTHANTQHTTKPPDRSPFTPRGGDTDTYPAVPGERTSKDVVALREEMATKAEIGPHDYLSDGRWTASKDALGVSGYPSKYPVPRQAISRIDQEAPPISGRNSNNLPSPRRASVPDDTAVSSPREVKSSPAGRADGGAPCQRMKEGEPVEDFEFVDAPRLYTPPPEYTSAGGVTEVAAAVSPCDDEAGMRRAVAAKAAASPARAEVRSLVVRDRASDDPDPTDRTSSKTKAEANRAAAPKTSSSAKTNGVRDDVEIIIDFVPADGDNAPPDKGYRFQRAKELTRVLSSPASSGAVVTKALAKTLPGDIPHCAGKVRTLASQYEDEDKRSKEVSATQPETAATARDVVVQTRDTASAATRDNVAATRDAMVTRDSEAATRYSAAVTRDAMMIRNTPAATHDSTAATRHSEAASGVATPLDVIPVKAGGEIADRLFQEMRAYEKVRAAREHADPPRRDPAVTQEVPLSEKAISRMTANEKMRAVQAIITSREATPEPRGDDPDPTPPHPSRSPERVVQSERDYEELEVTSSYVGDEVAGETRDGSYTGEPFRSSPAELCGG
ncbi:PREDICTED: uncharacterized protein LOC106814259 [Priapulus caudatus]|uniref:Uncharacterized protein LOC106814259 n=1 Tax=Priapulus caudatus TaxID=37621 RepID=A0ABM1EPC0_PRICU|nr:PREDICTED: uncharacterized protein LOC106814259 [Priapulus caudatus]